MTEIEKKLKSITAWLLLLAMIVTMLPTGLSGMEVAQAADISSWNLVYRGGRQYEVYLDEDRNLIITGQYFSDSSSTVSYHTTTLYFTAENSYGNPTSVNNRSYNVSSNHKTEFINGFSYDTYTIPRSIWEGFVRELCKESGSSIIYMSEGFRLKKRSSVSTEKWTLFGKEYNTLEGIQNAANWSSQTKYNFQLYFDVQFNAETQLGLTTDYAITITHDNGGYASANKETCAAGTEVSVYATPDDGYIFDGWEITSGYVTLKDSSEATTSFAMPNSDVVLHAKFAKSLTPVATKKPITQNPTPTPDPNVTPAPTAIPVPTTMPVPTPTEAPTIPSIDIDVYDNYTKYYTTDAGYSIHSIYNTGMIAGCNSDASNMSSSYSRVNNTILKSANSYTVGTDENGNEWYFIPTTEGATYVHPKIYNGYDVSTTEIRYITELTFPSKLSWGYNTADVVSIGGGLAGYNTEANSPDFTIVKGSFGYSYDNDSVYDEEADYFCIWNTYMHRSYCYGVIGNGEIISSVAKQRDWTQAGEHRYHHWGYSHNHYVYNTTLEYITIPSTVTRIEDYAFYNCQALRKISGAAGVTEIGTGAFEGASVLTTAKSKPGTDENGWPRNTYYYYNGSYSAGTPTTTMTRWEGAVALKEYFQLPKFGAVQTIGAYSFQRRKNLFDVTLVSGVSTVQGGAFAACDLNSITVPGKTTVINGGWTTLGSKGTPAETIIYTEPEAKAMHYGLNNDAYYITRAGYEITYHNNATPKEVYTSKAMVQNVYVEIDTQVGIYKNASADYPVSPDKTFTLDTDGAVWPVSNLSGIKIKSLHSVGYRAGQSGTSYGQSGSYYNKTVTAVAVAENGKVYGYDPVNDTWVDLGIPEGSTNHTWSTNRVLGDFGSSYSNSSQSGGYSNYSIATTQYLYYLNPDGRLCRKKMCYQKSVSTYPGSTETSARSSGNLSFLTSGIETLSMPSTVGIASFSVTEPVTGSTKEAISDTATGTYYTDKEERSYTLNLATIYAIDKNGDSWIGGGSKTESYYYFQWSEYNSYSGNWSGETTKEVSDGYNETEFETGVIPVSAYSWAKQEEPFRQVFAAGGVLDSYSPYWSSYDYNRNIIDAEGNLLFVANSRIQAPTSSNYYATTGGNGEVFEVLTGANFVKAEQTEGGYYILIDVEGGVWIYYASGMLRRYTHHYSTMYYVDISTPVKLFDDASVYKVWDTYRNTYTSNDYGSKNEFFYDIVIQDDKGRFWNVSTQKVASNSYGSGESSYYETWKDTAVSRLTSYEDSDTGYLRIGYEYVETLYANMFERDGYRFLCWNPEADGGGKDYMPGSKLCVWEPTTIYAQWDEQKNIIRYAPNGGAGYMEEDVYELSVTTATLKRNTFTRAGNEFLGWNTKADGSGTYYADGQAVVFSEDAGGSVLTVYAQWKPFGYTVKVAEDDIRVTPPTFTEIVELSYNEEMTVPVGPEDKAYTVSYSLNVRSDMGTTPYWKTVTPFTEDYTKATLTFLGWQLYEETVEGYEYIGFYQSGDTVKNVAKHDGATLVLFPYWGGEAAYVKLPVAGCSGYEFLGFTPDKSYAAGTFSTDTQLAKAVEENTLVIAGEGSGAQYKPTKDEILYAYYVPREDKLCLEVIPEQSEVELFSEVYQAEEGIPSTETVDLRATCGAFLVSCVLEQRSGIETVRAHVTVTYRTQYTDAESGELVISEPQTATVEVPVPKEWSYWTIVEGGVYFPEMVAVENTGLEEGKVTVPVGSGTSQKTSYRLTTYDEEERLLWSTYDTDGMPSLTLSVTEELCIVSEVPGELPDVDSYLRRVCSNEAGKDKTQFSVRSDGISVDGITLLSDEWGTDGQGAEPQYEAVSRLKDVLRAVGAISTEQSKILLAVTAKNGEHTSVAEVIYRAGEEAVGKETEKCVPVDEVNNIFIHTPAVCVAELTADHESEYQCAMIPEGREVLVLDETGACSEFVLQIGNYGYHSEKKGYGERSYTKHLAQKDGKPRNEVRFPVEVWVDVGNDKCEENDILLPAEKWYTVGTEAQRFYLPFWIPEGEYTFETQAVAANGEGREMATEETGNRNAENYVAVSGTDVFVTGRLYDFTVYGISGTAAWEEVREDNLRYTVGLAGAEEEDRDWFDTLPLRKGVHPYYRNLGGLPIGGSFFFRLKSVGSFFEDGTKLTLVPEVVCVTENGYEAVDVYFEKETENGVFLTKWDREESEITLLAEETSVADENYGEAVRYWYGTFLLPEEIYVANAGTDVAEYRKRYGLDFTEEFWRKEEILLLRFYVKLENAAGEVLYYGAVPEEIPNSIWCLEAGVTMRTDANGIRYPIYGGEVAVLYPGESGRNDYVIHGIY